MLLQFQTPHLRDCCEDQSTAEQEFGDAAAILYSALADLRAAASLAAVPPTLFEPVASRKGTFSIIAGRLQLQFVQNHREPPLLIDGNLDVARVTRIKITSMERNND